MPSPRTWICAVLVGLISAAALAAGAFGAAPDGRPEKLLVGAEEGILRLSDLPPVYQISDDAGCSTLDPGRGGKGPVEKLLARYLPGGCEFEYERVFDYPGRRPAPPEVDSVAIDFPSSKGAEEFFALARRPALQAEGVALLAEHPAIGDEALLFRTVETVGGKTGRSGIGVFWRDGPMLAGLTAAGDSPAADRRAALELAALQQQRIETPTPFAAEEQDDSDVRLNDPAIGFPGYWLGSRFAPGHGLPATELRESFVTRGPGEAPPGQRAGLWYDGFNLDLWTQKSWKAFLRSQLGPLNRMWKCTTSQRIELDRGHAEVFSAYGKNFGVCPKRAPDRFYAIARIDGMVIGINLIICTGCIEAGGGPYNSAAAMKAIVRGLKLRPKPVY